MASIPNCLSLVKLLIPSQLIMEPDFASYFTGNSIILRLSSLPSFYTLLERGVPPLNDYLHFPIILLSHGIELTPSTSNMHTFPI